jgi:hypothetical protein
VVELPEWNLPKPEGAVAAWPTIVEMALRACARESVQLSWKTKYQNLSLMSVHGGSAALLDLLDVLDRLAESVDPATGAARLPRRRITESASSRAPEELETVVGPLPGLAQVVGVVGSALTVEELAAFLNTPQPAFAGQSGAELLTAGDIAPVVALVTYIVTPADLGTPLERGSRS